MMNRAADVVLLPRSADKLLVGLWSLCYHRHHWPHSQL